MALHGHQVLTLHARFCHIAQRSTEAMQFTVPMEILAPLWAAEQLNQRRADASGVSYTALILADNRRIRFCQRCLIKRVPTGPPPP